MYKKRKEKKNIAIKHCSQHFTTANTPKLQRAVHPSSDIGGWFGGASAPIACLHTQGVSERDVPSEKLKILYFWNWNRAIWNISANLDQAMSKNKKTKKRKREKKKEKKRRGKQKTKQKQKNKSKKTKNKKKKAPRKKHIGPTVLWT